MTQDTPDIVASVGRAIYETWRQQPIAQEWTADVDFDLIVAKAAEGHEASRAVYAALLAEARAAVSVCDKAYADEIASLRQRVAELERAADSVVFHYLCCLGGCHESMASLARLAKLCGFKGSPPDMEEIEEALAAPRDRGKTHDCYADEQRDFRQRAEAAESQRDAAHAALIAYRQALLDHWLTGIHCDEATETDVATCYCTVWRSEALPSVGDAVRAWISHVEQQAALKAPEAIALRQRERAVIEAARNCVPPQGARSVGGDPGSGALRALHEALAALTGDRHE